ncbi:MAG: hypothetical protein ISP74_09230 [Bacteroidia bacterium]|nr:hypothetical protein [Bacteroidia bacterium]
MKSLFKIPKPLGIAVIFSVFIYLLINLYLNRFEELFEGGYELGVLTSKICMSFITGYFFYVVVYQVKSEKDKQNLNDFLTERIDKIIGSYYSIHQELVEKNKVYTSAPPEKEEIESLLKLIETNELSKPEIYNGKLTSWTWFELFLTEKRKALEQINFLMTSHIIDSELLKILGKIVDSKHFFWIEESKKFGSNFKQFSIFSEYIYEYSLVINELVRYAYKNKLMKTSHLTHKELEFSKRIGRGEKISKNEIEEFLKKSETIN